MTDESKKMEQVIEAFRQKAPSYDKSLKFFGIFSNFGFDISGWLKKAILELNLKNGDTVVDIGCGTGASLPFLHQAVGPEGKIIGVDLSKEMLSEAHQLVTANQWTNIELVCADAAKFEFPPKVDAVLSAYTLILVPDSESVISNACKALIPGGRLVVLDMAWPKYFPLWWRHVLFFLRTYGVTYDVLSRRSWETVQKTMANQLDDFTLRKFWFGFFYLACGAVDGDKQSQ